jgi:hypothetical protein
MCQAFFACFVRHGPTALVSGLMAPGTLSGKSLRLKSQRLLTAFASVQALRKFCRNFPLRLED